jgi:MerR family transcriptional regulator, light-induced transcriptional regulator
MTLSSTPIYNLGAVLKETGLAADTLRAWERRYGIPKPKRTPGGHRLYSDRDVRLIKWLQGRQAEGMAISRAVQQWKELVAAGNDPLEGESKAAPEAARQSPIQSNLATLRDQWLAACLAFDEATGEQVLNQAYAQYSVEVVTADVIQRALHDVGEMWTRGEASVQQEHFLSALSRRRLDGLIAATPAPTYAGQIVLACAEGEPHSLPMLYLNLLLRRRGRRVIFLGEDVPTAQIETTAQSVNAAMVVLSAERLVSAARLRDEAVLLTKKRIPVAFGGRIFIYEPELQQHVPGTYLGNDIQGAVDRIEQLLSQPAAFSRRMPALSGETALAFREARTRIEYQLHQHFGKTAVPSRLLTVANAHFGSGLAAALDLGNVRYMQADMHWIQTVLTGQGLPPKILREYLQAYADAVRKVMGARGAEITSWIRNSAAQI